MSLLQLMILTLPLVLAGASNMVFVKLPLLEGLRRPMDGGAILSDGKRVFGDNKTWKGFFGMIGLTSFWLTVMDAWAQNTEMGATLSPIPFDSFSFPEGGWSYGALWGLAYVLGELPNSFVKRRLDIKPGTNASGPRGLFFLVLDQADSVIACALALPLFCPITLIDGLVVVLLGSTVHFLTNALLFAIELKKQLG